MKLCLIGQELIQLFPPKGPSRSFLFSFIRVPTLLNFPQWCYNQDYITYTVICICVYLHYLCNHFDWEKFTKVGITIKTSQSYIESQPIFYKKVILHIQYHRVDSIVTKPQYNICKKSMYILIDGCVVFVLYSCLKSPYSHLPISTCTTVT